MATRKSRVELRRAFVGRTWRPIIAGAAVIVLFQMALVVLRVVGVEVDPSVVFVGAVVGGVVTGACRQSDWLGGALIGARAGLVAMFVISVFAVAATLILLIVGTQISLFFVSASTGLLGVLFLWPVFAFLGGVGGVLGTLLSRILPA
jgi:hypothetical protein